MFKHKSYYLLFLLGLILAQACSPSSATETDIAASPMPSDTSIPATSASSNPTVANTETVPATPIILPVTHQMVPADVLPAAGKQVDDVDSSGTAPEKRAPYGDSYKLNRLERPFLEDMTYVPELDIKAFDLSQDTDWYYITIKLVGSDSIKSSEIDYGVEFDLNLDGFGDYLIWAHPPYDGQWDTSTVQVFQDTNQDTAGLSGVQADGEAGGDGYDTLIFDGGTGQNPDPDLAWVRVTDSQPATVQFAVKKSLVGSSFLMGVVSDAGLKDVARFDYNDHFSETEAGSPVRGKENYPLGGLFAVDNTCWEPYGFQSTGFEPKVCPSILQPVNKPADGGEGQPLACNPPPDCGGGPYDPVTCTCQ